jgi:hypothetical protein
MSIPQFGKLIGLDRKALDRLINNGEGPPVLVITHASTPRPTRRILARDAEAWIRKHLEASA